MMPYCEKHHFNRQGAAFCYQCKEPVKGRCITAMGQKFHPEHFVCAFCMRQLTMGTFKEHGERPYCMNCYGKLFGWAMSLSSLPKHLFNVCWRWGKTSWCVHKGGSGKCKVSGCSWRCCISHFMRMTRASFFFVFTEASVHFTQPFHFSSFFLKKSSGSVFLHCHLTWYLSTFWLVWTFLLDIDMHRLPHHSNTHKMKIPPGPLLLLSFVVLNQSLSKLDGGIIFSFTFQKNSFSSTLFSATLWSSPFSSWLKQGSFLCGLLFGHPLLLTTSKYIHFSLFFIWNELQSLRWKTAVPLYLHTAIFLWKNLGFQLLFLFCSSSFFTCQFMQRNFGLHSGCIVGSRRSLRLRIRSALQRSSWCSSNCCC